MSVRPGKRFGATADPRRAAASLTLGLLAALCLASAATVVILGSRLTFFNDEWYVLLLRPGVSADTLLEPHNGHLSVLPIAVYKVLVALFGLDQQIPFRVTLAVVIASVAVLVFTFVRERCGDLLALCAAAILLFLGPAWQDLLWSFQIGLVGSLAAGIGVLLALERGTRRGDLVACGLLVASIALSNLGVSFVIAAATVVLIRRRLADAWIAGIPALLFAVWWLAYGSDAETGFSLANVARTPFYVLDSISAALASLTGLSTNVGGGTEALAWGRPLLVLAAFGAAVWLSRGGRPPVSALPIAAAALSWWVLLGADFLPNWREPDTSRYQLISVTFLILLAAEAFRPLRPGRSALGFAAALTLVIVVSNIGALKDGYDFFRAESAIAKADLAALDVGEGQIAPKFRLLQPIAGSIYMTGVFAGPYYRERDDHGSPAYSTGELAEASPAARAAADVVLSSGYGLDLEFEPGRAPPGGGGCRSVGPGGGSGGEVEVAAGTVGLANLGAVPARVKLRRYADDFAVDLGDLLPGRAARLRIPVDRAPQAWRLAVEGGRVEVCAASGA